MCLKLNLKLQKTKRKKPLITARKKRKLKKLRKSSFFAEKLWQAPFVVDGVEAF